MRTYAYTYQSAIVTCLQATCESASIHQENSPRATSTCKICCNVDPGLINAYLLMRGCSPPKVIIFTKTRDTPVTLNPRLRLLPIEDGVHSGGWVQRFLRGHGRAGREEAVNTEKTRRCTRLREIESTPNSKNVRLQDLVLLSMQHNVCQFGGNFGRLSRLSSGSIAIVF